MDTYLLAARSEAVLQILAAAHAPLATAPSADEISSSWSSAHFPRRRRRLVLSSRKHVPLLV
jgi:hypothetical protein